MRPMDSKKCKNSWQLGECATYDIQPVHKLNLNKIEFYLNSFK